MNTILIIILLVLLLNMWGIVSLVERVRKLSKLRARDARPTIRFAFLYIDARTGAKRTSTYIDIVMGFMPTVNDFIQVEKSLADKYGIPHGSYIIRHCHHDLEGGTYSVHAERQELYQ